MGGLDWPTIERALVTGADEAAPPADEVLRRLHLLSRLQRFYRGLRRAVLEREELRRLTEGERHAG